MEQQIKVGAVSYLNTRPLIYGFEEGMMQDRIDLLFDYPAKIASLLLDKQIDIGLVPVAVIPRMGEYHIIADYCIGSKGEVASVCLFSDVPLEEITTVLLDYQSRTSVALLRLLLAMHWKIKPSLVAATADYEKNIRGTTAGLVIGDRALLQRKHSKYIYDLGLAWKEMTGLPFVFAAWVSNREQTADFKAAFNKANQFGFDHLPTVIRKANYHEFDLQAYYTRYIDYRLDDEKKKGLELFLQLISPAAV